MLEYSYMYLNKHSSGYAIILNATDAVYSIRSLSKLLSSYRDRSLLEHYQTLKMKLFANIIIKYFRNISRQGRFRGTTHFDKYFVVNTRKKDPARKHFKIFFPRYS